MFPTNGNFISLVYKMTPTQVLRSKNVWSDTSTPQYVCMAWCLVKHGTLPSKE